MTKLLPHCPRGSKSSPTFLTVRDVAARLGTCERTVHRRIADGQLVAHQIGRLVRIAEADLELFIASRRRVRE